MNAATHKEREANAQAQAALAAQQQLAQQQIAQQQLAQQKLAQQQLAQQQLAQQQLAQQQLVQQQLLAQQNSAATAVIVQQQKQVLKNQKSISPPVVNGSISGNIAVQAHLQSQTNVLVSLNFFMAINNNNNILKIHTGMVKFYPSSRIYLVEEYYR